MAKKKAARKGLPPTGKRVAKAKANKETESEVQTQTVIDGAFPDRVEDLEAAAKKMLTLKAKAKKANENLKQANNIIAQLMIDNSLEKYKCYDERIELKRSVDTVGMRSVPEKEATPYDPSSNAA